VAHHAVPKKVTLKTISERLGVSPATISKALRDSTDISDDMKMKVRAITDELGYHPNLLARSLVQKRSNIIGVIVPDLNISYYADLVQYIYENAQMRGYESIVMFHHEDPVKERKNLQFLMSLQVDGILISLTNGNKNRDMLTQIQTQGTPVVCYDRRTDCADFSLITIDDHVATEALLRSFVDQGRRKIGYVGLSKGDDVTVARFNSYRKLLPKLGLCFKPDMVVESEPDARETERTVRKALQEGLDVDALVCGGGFWAYASGKAILAEGRRMPEDIILGEFGNNSIVQRLGISYFTIDQSPDLISAKAVELLDNFLKDKNKDWGCRQLFVESKLIYYDHYNHEEKIVKIIK